MPTKIDNHILSLIISGRAQKLNLDSFSAAEWNLLAEQARAQDVAPLLYWWLSNYGVLTSIPKSTHDFLRSAYAQSWRQNQIIFNELETLARMFNQAQIPIVVLKGACFALTIYSDIGLRPMGDLDILIPKPKIAEAVQIAKTIGYEETAPEAFSGLEELLGHHVYLQKNNSQSPLTLEIHHSLVADKSFVFAVPVDWFWEHTEPLGATSLQMNFDGLRMLTPAAQILYAAAHAMLQHGGVNTSLRWYYDLDRLIRVYAERVDWDALLLQAEKFEWGSAVDAALSQTEAYFNTPMPDSVRERLSTLKDRHAPLIELLRKKPATRILEEWQKLLTLNWAGRFRVIMGLVIPNPAYMRWRYNLKTSWALPFYYLYRWCDIAVNVLQTTVSLLLNIRLIGK